MRPAHHRAVDGLVRYPRREYLRAAVPHLPLRSERVALRSILALAAGRLEFEGHDVLRREDGPRILAINHLNNVEAVLTPIWLIWLREGRRTAFLSDWMFARIPLVGWLIRHGGTIPVWTKRAKVPGMNRHRRRARPGEPLALAEEALRDGRWVGMYPEARRNRDPKRLLRGRRGTARLALSSGAPVLPIGIDFHGRERSERIPAFPRMIIRIGRDLSFDEEREVWRAGDRARRRAVEDAVTARIMEAIGSLSGKRPADEEASGGERGRRTE